MGLGDDALFVQSRDWRQEKEKESAHRLSAALIREDVSEEGDDTGGEEALTSDLQDSRTCSPRFSSILLTSSRIASRRSSTCGSLASSGLGSGGEVEARRSAGQEQGEAGRSLRGCDDGVGHGVDDGVESDRHERQGDTRGRGRA